MPEYIKRTDLIEAVEELLKSPYANDNSENILLRQFSCGVRDALKLVRDMAKDDVPDSMKIPSADVRENVRGRWITYNELASDMLVCSECERYFIGSGDEYDYNFCPNCGADMRGNDNV